MYEQQLKDLGLTDNEVRIYLVLLKNGMMNPYRIADKTGLHRGYIYDALERMQDKGAVNSVRKSGKKHYQATAPGSLVELLKLKLEALEKAVPSLNKLMSIAQEDTKVELHKGKLVYRTLIKDILATAKKGETVFLIGIDEATLMREIEPIYLKRYLNFVSKKGIKEKILIKKRSKRFAHKNLEYRELDEQYIGKTAQIIYRNKVATFILGSPYYLIVIENKDVADTYRKQFNLLWNIAKA
jgi:sugar-specific transcriptional regulator TrmB